MASVAHDDEEANLHILLRGYPVGSADRIVGAGGTAGKTWRVTTASGEYLLRLRGGAHLFRGPSRV